MGVAGGPTDQSGDRGKGSDQDKAKKRQPSEDRGQEPAKRRSRRVQKKDQQKQWRDYTGGCWPSPPKDDSKSK